MATLVTGMKNYFDDVAEEWELVDETRMKGWKQFHSLLNLQGYESIDEFGCGRGSFLRYLGEKTTGKVTGIEDSQKMVDIARKITYGLPNVEVIRGDATNIDLPPGSVDVALSYMVYQWADSRLAFLVTNKRVVKNGGKVALATVTDEDGRSFSQYMEFLQQIIDEYPEYYVADTPHSLMRFPRFSPRDLEKEFLEAGLKNVRTFGIFEENTDNVDRYIKRVDMITNGYCFSPLNSNPELQSHVKNVSRPQILQELLERDGKLVMERTRFAVANT